AAPQAEGAALRHAQHEALLEIVRSRILPLLQGPLKGRAARLTLKSRWALEFSRSLTLALFVLLWFVTVPVPGLLVFTYGAYRFSVGLGAILFLLVGTIAFVL